MANGFGQGSFTCTCPPGTIGSNCGSGILGTNFYAIRSQQASRTSYGQWVQQSLIAYPPFSKIDWTVAVVLIPSITTSYPGWLELALTSPAGYSAYPTMSDIYIYNEGCDSEFDLPIYDNLTMAWGVSTPTSLCSATAFTGYGLVYSYNGYWDCFVPNCNVYNNLGTFISDPFATTFQKGGGTAAGAWTFSAYDVSGSYSIINGWTVQFYRRPPSFPSFLSSCS